MATIRPFRPFRYTPEAGPIAELVAPPYDVISEPERARLRTLREAGAIHVILPLGEEKYRTAADLLETWKAAGLIAQEDKPAMYLYSQGFEINGETFVRWGLLTSLQLEEFDDRIVLPHERTLDGPKADRMQLIRACETNLSPIFTFIDKSLGLAGMTDRGEQIVDFTDEAGVTQRVWRLTDESLMAELMEKISSEPVYIADGHHRYETSLAYRNERRNEAGAPTDPQPYDFVLTHMCSTKDPGLVVLPTHRLLADPAPHGELLANWEANCKITAFDDAMALWTALGVGPVGERVPRLGILRRGVPGGLLLEPGDGARKHLDTRPPSLSALDVTFLHEVVLDGVAPDRFKYTHDEHETITAVEKGETELAVLLPPPGVDDVLAIARDELTMPQKSTYFYPKVLSGLAYNPIGRKD
ncbi:MAG: DUF1015 domain-containing protein [Candidatus Binatia bacterium]|nr:DUF1015 domain-containing protein [Candidatus Binatia bacterium]